MNPYSSKKQSNGPPPLTTPGEKPQSNPSPSPKPPQEQQANSVTIPPESVAFRTADEVCESCQYMQQDGMCSALSMAVEPKDSCQLHSSGGPEPEAEEALPQ